MFVPIIVPIISTSEISSENTLVYHERKTCSNFELFNNKNNYIKAVAIDRSFTLNVINRMLSKPSTVSDSVPINNFKMLLSYLIFLRLIHKFPIFSLRLVSKLFSLEFFFSILKDLIDGHNIWGIYRFFCEYTSSALSRSNMLQN